MFYGGREVDLAQLVLFAVHHRSRGSIQPVIGVVVPNLPPENIWSLRTS